MTLEQWRQNEKLAQWAGQVFSSPNGQLFLNMLRESHPAHSQLPFNVTDSMKVTELGRIYGYDTAINNIEAACVAAQIQMELTETFGDAAQRIKPSKK